MKRLRCLALLLSVGALALAQTPHSVTLNWSWSQGSGSPGTGFNVKRATVAGTYSSATAAAACVGSPGNTVGAFGSLCQDAAGSRYACTKAGGCAVTADWAIQGLIVGSPGITTLTFTDTAATGNVLTEGSAYYYVVTTRGNCTDSAGVVSPCQSAPTNEVRVSIPFLLVLPPNSPTGLSGTAH